MSKQYFFYKCHCGYIHASDSSCLGYDYEEELLGLSGRYFLFQQPVGDWLKMYRRERKKARNVPR